MKGKFAIYIIINYNYSWIIKFNKKKYIYNVQLYDIFGTYNRFVKNKKHITKDEITRRSSINK